MANKLTEQQRLFCEHYIISMNATQSVIKAGYTDNYGSAAVQGSRLLNNVNVKKYIDELMHEKTAQLGITQAEIIRGIKKLATDENVNPNVRLNAYCKLGDFLQMFKSQPQVVINNEVNTNFDNMTDEEIEKELKRLEEIEDE